MTTLCSNCGGTFGDHDRDGRCPRDISQPVSRVVSAPPAPALTQAEHDALEACRRHPNGAFDVGAWSADIRSFRERHHTDLEDVLRSLEGRGFVDGRWDVSAAGLSALKSADADSAAFSALTAEQRAALLKIGADGAALLEAARTMANVAMPGMVAWVESGALRRVIACIDARKA